MGNSKIRSYLDYLYELDYKERPVSIDEFLDNNQFLGTLTAGGKNVIPIWRATLKDISVEDSKYLDILTGAIGTGKTTTAIEGLAYVMHRVLCLRDPWQYFKKIGGGKMAIVFFNLTKSLGESKGFNLLQSCLLSSSWFKSRGIVCGSEKNPRVDFPIFEYKLASPQAQGFGFIGENVIAAIMDEVDSPIASEPQKKRIISAFESVFRRFESRFVFDGQSIGRLFLVASKQEQLSFLNTFIIKMKGAKEVYVKDIAIWEARDKSDYSGEKFLLSLGDTFTPPIILNSEEEATNAKSAGFQIIEIPVEYRQHFERDTVGSLRDLAGISTSHLRKTKLFASESVLMKCYDKSKPNPVKVNTIEIGLKDEIDLINYIDFSAIRTQRRIPRYVHIDIAFSRDALGLGMSCISGWTKINTMLPDGTFKTKKLPVAETDLAMRIKARPGDQIPLHKIRKLILDLKEVQKFNIEKVTFDLKIASADSMQILDWSGIQCESLSMDKNPQMYRGFRDLANEGRWVCFFDPFLHFELSNLEDDPVKNKIDHPDEVRDIQLIDGGTKEIILSGSKDKADGVAGSVMKAIEECKDPPDIEVMKQLMSAVMDENHTTQDLSSLVEVKSEKKKAEDRSNNSNESITYKEILRKALQ